MDYWISVSILLIDLNRIVFECIPISMFDIQNFPVEKQVLIRIPGSINRFGVSQYQIDGLRMCLLEIVDF